MKNAIIGCALAAVGALVCILLISSRVQGCDGPCCGDPVCCGNPCCHDPCSCCGTCQTCSNGTCVSSCPPAGGCPAGTFCQTPPGASCPSCMGTCYTLTTIPPQHASCDCVPGSGCGTAQYDIQEQKICMYGATSGASSCSPNVVNLGYFYPCSDTLNYTRLTACALILGSVCTLACGDTLGLGCYSCIVGAGAGWLAGCQICDLHICTPLWDQGTPDMGHQDSVSGSCS
jgi:hypothetical protein